VTVIDFDTIKKKNLDRLCYAMRNDLNDFGRGRAKRLAERLREITAADRFEAKPVEAAVFEEEGWQAALDCDVVFSCVEGLSGILCAGP
jgi:molybdopterin-synthase adenylyltransferase